VLLTAKYQEKLHERSYKIMGNMEKYIIGKECKEYSMTQLILFTIMKKNTKVMVYLKR
jgi:hypothetical protein